MWSWPILGTITPHAVRRPKEVLQVFQVMFDTGGPPGSQLRTAASRQSDHNARRKQLIGTDAEGLCYHVCHSYGQSGCDAV